MIFYEKVYLYICCLNYYLLCTTIYEKKYNLNISENGLNIYPVWLYLVIPDSQVRIAYYGINTFYPEIRCISIKISLNIINWDKILA